jgi:cold shock CspA family protein
MEEILYNILWIDDEHETLSGTKGRAKRNGINLFPYKSLDGGMSELERNYPFYDGVLLDAKFFENENDEAGTEDTYASFRAKDRILALPKKFKIFVLTGQAEAYEDKTFKKAFLNVYEKGKDEDVNKLFADIKDAAKTQVDTQIRHTYKRVFDVCTERYVGEYAGQDLLKLLKVSDESNLENNFTSIRKIVEDLFVAFHKFNLLPLEFVSPTVALNQSSIFLAGGEQHEKTDAVYKQHRHLEETHLPPPVAAFLKNILSITQAGSHRSAIDKHVQFVKTPYLFKSVLFQLLDVLVWFKMYVDSSPKTENWERIETDVTVPEETIEFIEGEVINYNPEKGFAFFKPVAGGSNTYIPPHLVTLHSLGNGDAITVQIEDYVDSRSGETKTKVKKIDKVVKA